MSYSTFSSNALEFIMISCKCENDSSVKFVVFGHVSCCLYLSITCVKSFSDVSGKNSSIDFAIVSLSLLCTKSNPFCIAFVKFTIKSLFSSI